MRSVIFGLLTAGVIGLAGAGGTGPAAAAPVLMPAHMAGVPAYAAQDLLTTVQYREEFRRREFRRREAFERRRRYEERRRRMIMRERRGF